VESDQLATRAAGPAGSALRDELFVSLTEQLDKVRQWNAERGWGLSAADLDAVDLSPRAESDPLVVDLVAVYLEDDATLNGVRRTCHELWTVAAEQQPHRWCWDWYWDKWKNRPKPVRLRAGIVHRPGVRRVSVDLRAHFEPGRYVRPSQVLGRDSAHAELLAAAALFPRWIRAMDGKTVPHVWLAGYEVMSQERPSPERLPALSWSGFRRHMSLTADWIDHAHSGWAAPTCLS
jgi:hypothetical protein